MQTKIYKASFSNFKRKTRQLQSFLVHSYAAKLFVVRYISESRNLESLNEAKGFFNALNPAQKLNIALSLETNTSSKPSDLKNELGLFWEVGCKQLLYMSLRPEWEAHSKRETGISLLDREVDSLMHAVVDSLNRSEFTNQLYIATLVVEKSILDVGAILNFLSTLEEFHPLINQVLNRQSGDDHLFPILDMSQSHLDVRSLESLLSHILLLNCEMKCVDRVGLHFYRYQDTIMCCSTELEELHNFFSQIADSLSVIGLTYNKKKSRIFTKQQTFRFLGFEIASKFLVIKEKVYSQSYLNASKEQRKLVLAKARYILRSKRKDGTTRAKTNMPLSKAIVLINPLIINWRSHYCGLIPRATQEQLDWLLNEKVYRWYVKRLKKNRVTHWNKKCVKIVNNKKRISQDSYTLELFNKNNA
nr:mat1b [Erythrotrichia foliiformis]